MVSLYKNILNVPIDHYLKNVEIPFSFYIPNKQERNMLLSNRGQCLLGTEECPDGMPLSSLNSSQARGGRATDSYWASCYTIKACCM